ncbi:unnamed protein product [Musa acuminata subsp. malaccensis]|uniref:(wild Malaysian banana) hypothetical protein n=1 Tax=Musa acuminata subsp. malaccensis TaxID=214687 RepID=A0A8D6ZSI1_MUSAM|nr:unnamed protein product [Musa acuminata subsp. malaccensis]
MGYKLSYDPQSFLNNLSPVGNVAAGTRKRTHCFHSRMLHETIRH